MLKEISPAAETQDVPPPTREIPMSAIPAQRTARTTIPASPASLTQVRRSDAGCPECGSARLTHLAMTLTDGTPVQFASCHECEHRSWSHQGTEMQFTDVIARATKQKV
jgi:DNA-directed RNA polymerase subunit M/transcription elongation factor TFIIS